MIERKVVSQCPTADYCVGWNDAVDAMLKWISVEERLPDAEGMHIVYIKRNVGNAFVGTDYYDFSNGWCGEGWYDGRYVSHWMSFDSLTEPPQEEA